MDCLMVTAVGCGATILVGTIFGPGLAFDAFILFTPLVMLIAQPSSEVFPGTVVSCLAIVGMGRAAYRLYRGSKVARRQRWRRGQLLNAGDGARTARPEGGATS